MKYIKRFSAGAKKLMIGVVGVVSLIWAVGGVLFTPAGPLYTTPRGEIRGGSEIPEVASFLNAYHPKKNEVFLLTSLPHVYWLFSLENPLPWDMLVPGFHSAGQVAEVVRQLRTVCPEWMIMDWGMENIAGWGRIFWPKIDRDLLLHNPLMPFLSSQYIRTSSSASVRIYHRKRDHCE